MEKYIGIKVEKDCGGFPMQIWECSYFDGERFIAVDSINEGGKWVRPDKSEFLAFVPEVEVKLNNGKIVKAPLKEI